MIEITLTKWECAQAAIVGVLRQTEAIGRNLKSKLPSSNPFQIHCEGACGEMAASKAIDRYWSGSVNTFKNGGDIGEKVQVRTASKPDGKLVVRSDDRDDDYFILVTGQAPTYYVHGWLLGKDAKKAKYLDNPAGRGEAWFVPQSDLRPLDTLPEA